MEAFVSDGGQVYKTFGLTMSVPGLSTWQVLSSRSEACDALFKERFASTLIGSLITCHFCFQQPQQLAPSVINIETLGHVFSAALKKPKNKSLHRSSGFAHGYLLIYQDSL
jgi:hypothetical protein